MNIVRLKTTVGLVSLGALVSACGSTETGLSTSITASGVSSVSGGQVQTTLSSESNGSVTRAGVGLTAFVSGLNTSRGTANAFAGIQPGANVGAAETGGTGSYSARYQFTGIDNVRRNVSGGFGTISGDRIADNESSITLNADFNAGTLTGSTSEIDVNGTISGSNLGGNVVVDYNNGFGSGVSGTLNTDLTGQIGATGVIGVFTGEDSNTVVAGGIVGTRN